MALSVTWQGYADADTVSFDFFTKDHTVVARFMPQYPHAYDGALITNFGGGEYFLGQGDYQAGNLATKLILRIGGHEVLYETILDAGHWNHVAVVRAGDVFRVYINAVAQSVPIAITPEDGSLPTGTLRFGQDRTPDTVRQFYGFIDDVGIFDKALSANEIQALSNAKNLTGNEPNLKYGWTFGGTVLPSAISPPVVLHGTAKFQAVSPVRDDSVDMGLLPMPSQQQAMRLPFAKGEPWLVVQSFDHPWADSRHYGYASFTWDFILADAISEGEYPNGTGGAPLFASAPGKVVYVKEDEPSGTPRANTVQIEQNPNEICGYLHLRTNTAEVKVGDSVSLSQKIALAGDTGVGIGNNHLHIGVSDKIDPSPGLVTFPVAFSKYEIRQPDGTWHWVPLGIPQQGQVVRNSPEQPHVEPPILVDPFPKWWLWPIIAVRWVIRIVVNIFVQVAKIFNRRG